MRRWRGLTFQRGHLPFRAVNRRDRPGYDPGLQRHHLIPRQAMRSLGLAAMLQTLGHGRIGFDDFRRNGLLLPAREEAAGRMGLPLHRGPHRSYNEMVLERLGCIERGWSASRHSEGERAHIDAALRVTVLQGALRKRLLDRRVPLRLNRSDPLWEGKNFELLDAMAETLWRATSA